VLGKVIRYFISFYGVSKGEAIGFIVLIPVLFIVISAPLWFKYIYPVREVPTEEYLKEFQEWVAASEASIEEKEEPTVTATNESGGILHRFDPNSASTEELTDLGFKPWIAERIVKYRSAGGSFKDAQDLQKIYGISLDHLEMIGPFVDIPPMEEALQNDSKYEFSEDDTDYDKLTSEEVVAVKDLNNAVAEELVFIRGIGSVLSERIIKYRDLLGGYVSFNQVKEVYGLNPELVDELSRYFMVDTSGVEYLEVNLLKSEELRKHPYIDYNLSNAIEQYRIQHGHYNNFDDLRAIKILDDSTFQKILPYLKFN